MQTDIVYSLHASVAKIMKKFYFVFLYIPAGVTLIFNEILYDPSNINQTHLPGAFLHIN